MVAERILGKNRLKNSCLLHSIFIHSYFWRLGPANELRILSFVRHLGSREPRSRQPRMSDSSDQLSSSNSDCNSQMGVVHRNATAQYGNATSMSGLTHHPQNLTPTSNSSPQYPQELSTCSSASLSTNIANISSFSLSGTTSNFTPEQISCMCEALSQSQDIEKLSR